MDVKKIGGRIKEARLRAGLTQAQLAETVNLSIKYVSNLECGAKAPKLDTLVKLANALHTDANSLLADVLDCRTEIELTELSRQMRELPPDKQEKLVAMFASLIQNI